MTADRYLAAMAAYYALMAARTVEEMTQIAQLATSGADMSSEPRRVIEALIERGRVECV